MSWSALSKLDGLLSTAGDSFVKKQEPFDKTYLNPVREKGRLQYPCGVCYKCNLVFKCLYNFNCKPAPPVCPNEPDPENNRVASSSLTLLKILKILLRDSPSDNPSTNGNISFIKSNIAPIPVVLQFSRLPITDLLLRVQR